MTSTDNMTADGRRTGVSRPLPLTGPAPADLFNPAHYATVRRPVSEAANLPPWCYTSEAFFERELERLFRKTWNFVGRAERVPQPGDYFTVEIARVPLLVVRGTDGSRAPSPTPAATEARSSPAARGTRGGLRLPLSCLGLRAFR